MAEIPRLLNGSAATAACAEAGAVVDVSVGGLTAVTMGGPPSFGAGPGRPHPCMVVLCFSRPVPAIALLPSYYSTLMPFSAPAKRAKR